MVIADYTAQQWVTCYNETAEQIIGRTAVELDDLKYNDQEGYERVFNDATFASFNFKLRAQELSYNVSFFYSGCLVYGKLGKNGKCPDFIYDTWITGKCTIAPKGIVRFRSCNKAVVNVFPHKAEPSCATRTGQYLLGR